MPGTTDAGGLPVTLPASVLNREIRAFPGAAVNQGIDEALKALPAGKDLAVFAYAESAPGGGVVGKLGVAYRVSDSFTFAGDLEKRWTPGAGVDPLTWKVEARWTP